MELVNNIKVMLRRSVGVCRRVSVPMRVTTCCANSSESNITNGDALCHLMEEGGWDLLEQLI
jgi:hypothetical protein